MSVCLCVLGKHNIEFSNKSFEELYSEIKNKLDNMVIKNYQYLEYAQLKWLDPSPEEIEIIKQRKDWIIENKYDVKKEEFIEFGYLVFEGPLNLTIEFNKYNNIDIWDPSYLYSLWYQYGSDLQNEWRKYFYTVVHCFGGDRVIYIPEAFSSSAISTKYEYYEGTFDELENELKKDFGDSKKRLSELSYEQYDDYFIDMLDDIDWDYNAPMD